MMRRLAPLILLLLMAVPPVSARDWTLIRHQGQEWVTLENVAQFYGFDGIQKAGNRQTLKNDRLQLEGRVGSRELMINGVKFILSHPLTSRNGDLLVSRIDLAKLIEPVFRPQMVRNPEPVKTVILDPGHGGHDQGARSRVGNEKIFNLDVAERTRRLLSQRGYRVEMTRTRDEFISLDERVKFANQFRNAIFVSIHFNAGGSQATGLETYTLAPRGVPSTAADGPRVSDNQLCAGNMRDAENMVLATATHASLVSALPLPDRGIKRARFVVLRDIRIPGVLVECGFLSNPGEARLIASTAYRERVAIALARAIDNYQRAITGRRQPSAGRRTASGESPGRVGESIDLDRSVSRLDLDKPTVVVPGGSR